MPGENYRPIADYALIGDSRSAALISSDAAIEWLCWPRFDSSAFFSAILDREKGGRFRVGPAGPARTERRYVGDSNVLETVFRTGTGVLRIRDLMPVGSDEDRERELTPDHEILREVACLAGEVTVRVDYDPRPGYATVVPRLEERGSLGLWCQQGGHLLVLRSDMPVAPRGTEPGAIGEVTLRAGDTRYLSLIMATGDPAIIPPLGDHAAERVRRSVEWWERWASVAHYDGPYRDHVVRSALTLKLMTYAPSGAVIAAPTASLPEWIGGVRNWDYRYCWLRDASMTLRALLDLGYIVEGESFLSWLLHATRLTWPELQVLYDVYGESSIGEAELDHLDGYRGSRPVRVGNAAAAQLQLDLYGKVVDAAYQFVRRGGELDPHTGRLLTGLGRTVCRRWREPDEGIWEIRRERVHHTQSKAMCWVALDRLMRLHGAGVMDAPVHEFAAAMKQIRTEIEARGWNSDLRSYTRTLDGADVDAALLLLGLYGYARPAEPRMRATCARIRERLGENGLIYRYKDYGDYDGLPGKEGAFGICSFWAVECFARCGEMETAYADFERILAYGNDLGLFAEQADPVTGEALGNFPQAFTHIGLIDAAMTLAECEGEAEPPQEPRAERLREEARV